MSETLTPERSSGHSGILRLASDDRLARRGARGDRDAFEAIYRRYHQGLYRFCLSMVGNPEDAQDALQNTMVKVVRALPGEQRRIELKPWLYRIARNESVETLRRRRESTELHPEQLTGARELADTAASRERLQALFADLEQLPERQRAALILRELSGLDFKLIGASFGTSAAVARQTLYEARRSLRQMEHGREMSCDSVQRELSDADGRVTRRRELRAHLRDCPGCRSFRDAIEQRQRDFAAIVPLPLAVSAGVLQGVAGSKASAAVATSALAKSTATVAIVATVGVAVADRGGPIDPPFPGGGGEAQAPTSPSLPSPTEGGTHADVNRPQAPAGDRARGRPQERPRRIGVDGGGKPGQQTGAAPAPASPGTESDAPSRSSSQARAKRDLPSNGSSAAERGERDERGGSEDSLPGAASKGQETASGNKPDHAADPHGGESGSPPPGHGGTPPGQSTTPPGHGGTLPSPPQAPPGPPDSPPGKGSGKPGG